MQPLPLKVDLAPEKVAFGVKLLHDRMLSGDDTLNCAFCHDLTRGCTDQAKVATGIRGQQGAFSKLYPEEGLTQSTVTHAIAVFEKSLVTPNSRFDRYLRGEQDVLTANEKAGYDLFKTNCFLSLRSGARRHPLKKWASSRIILNCATAN